MHGSRCAPIRPFHSVNKYTKYAFVCMYVWVRMYGCVRVCMGVYVYVCMYVSIYIPVLKNVVMLKMYIEYINLFFKCVDRNDDIYGELQASLMAESQLSLLYQSQ